MISFLKRLFARKPKAPPATHVIRLNGLTAGVLSHRRGGEELTLCVFRSGAPWRRGDLLDIHSSAGGVYHYRVAKVDTPCDPGDQHFIDCTFSPRT